MMNRFYLYLIVSIFFSCDGKLPQIEAIYRLAEENRLELQSVLEHYSGEEQKLAATKFLLNSMLHSSTQSPSFEKYRNAILKSDSMLDYDKLWADIVNNAAMGKSFIVYDAKVITADYLIQNIDQAFHTWENAPWYEQIDFDTFCNYILPYRVLDEPISDWRKTLNDKYRFLIKDVKSPREAFDIIHRHVVKEFKDRNQKCQYTPDVMMLSKMLEGKCSNECIYLISVLRSLGIPATYDMVYYWANYSVSGHSWVVYGVDSLVQEKKSDSYEALKARYNISKFRHRVEAVKKRSKIYRNKYSVRSTDDVYKDERLLFFNNPFLEDVSELYGLSGKVEFHHKKQQQLFLCTFASVKDWQPVIKGINKGQSTVFRNIGRDIAYLPVYFSEKQMIPIENPFIFHEDGVKETLSPDTTTRKAVVLRRKYVLFSHWVGRWDAIVGSGIDVSNDPDFKNYKRLYHFEEVPDGITKVNFEASKHYRYIRFQAPLDTHPNIAEIRFYGINHHKDTVLLAGDIICEDISEEHVLKAFDNNYATYTQTPYNHYWFGLDLGAENKFALTRLEYCMRHDMNMIEVGDNYELFYYDYGWHSLGKQTATCDSLVYENVPSSSLLWLRNRTKGREERIFTYENEEQIWW